MITTKKLKYVDITLETSVHFQADFQAARENCTVLVPNEKT